MHPAHSGRRFGIHDIQFHIGRKLPLMTSRTQVVGPFNPRRTDYSEHRFGTEPLVLRVLPAGARQLMLVGGRSLVPEQFGQGRGSGLVKRRSQAGFYCFQIGLTVVLALRKHTGE
jgi:hypothetical protein